MVMNIGTIERKHMVTETEALIESLGFERNEIQ